MTHEGEHAKIAFVGMHGLACAYPRRRDRTPCGGFLSVGLLYGKILLLSSFFARGTTRREGARASMPRRMPEPFIKKAESRLDRGLACA